MLLGALAATLVATVIGAALVWPDRDRADDLNDEVTFLADGVSFVRGVVDEVQPACPSLNEQNENCGQLRATVGDGRDAEEVTVPVPPEVSDAGLEAGDKLRMLRIPGAEGEPVRYSFFGVERSSSLLLLTLVFVVVVVAVARWRGVRALFGLAFAGIAVLWFMLPALLSGESGLGWGWSGPPRSSSSSSTRRMDSRSGPVRPWPALSQASREDRSLGFVGVDASERGRRGERQSWLSQ